MSGKTYKPLRRQPALNDPKRRCSLLYKPFITPALKELFVRKNPLHIFCQDYLQQKSKHEFWSLLALCKAFPSLKSLPFATLIEFPKALRTAQSLDTPPEKIPRLLKKIDQPAFSALCIASLLINPTDGKGDNYFVEITRKAGKINKTDHPRHR